MLSHTSCICCLIVFHCLVFEESMQLVHYWFYLQGFYILLCAMQRSCFQVHAWINAFPGACTGNCMRLNTSNLCFNYDDLLSVGSLALHPQSASTSLAACIALYIEFYCLHRQTAVLTSFIKLPWVSTMLICSDDDREYSCKDVAPFAGLFKVDWILQGHVYNVKLVKRLQLFSFVALCWLSGNYTK